MCLECEPLGPLPGSTGSTSWTLPCQGFSRIPGFLGIEFRCASAEAEPHDDIRWSLTSSTTRPRCPSLTTNGLSIEARCAIHANAVAKQNVIPRTPVRYADSFLAANNASATVTSWDACVVGSIQGEILEGRLTLGQIHLESEDCLRTLVELTLISQVLSLRCMPYSSTSSTPSGCCDQTRPLHV